MKGKKERALKLTRGVSEVAFVGEGKKKKGGVRYIGTYWTSCGVPHAAAAELAVPLLV